MDLRRGWSFAWLGHPVSLIALVVMVLNDHVLKAAYPGWITGKLSDAAGLVFAPALLAAICRLRGRWVAIAVVGALFTIVKAWSYGAETASAVWSLAVPTLIRADVTDLLALPFLGVAAWTWQSARVRPDAGRLVRALRVAVLLPLALVGVAATSPARQDVAITVASAEDTIYLASRDLAHDSGMRWTRTVDLGRTWQPVDYADEDNLTQQFGETPRLACSPAQQRTCYRVMPGQLGVQASTDGGATWSDSWRVSDTDRQRLIREYGGQRDPDEVLVSAAVVVHDTGDGAGGHVVVVANGRDGFAMRDEAGVWTRIGFPRLGPTAAEDVPELGRQSWYAERLTIGVTVAAVILMAGLIVTVGGAWAASRSARRFSAWWAAPFALVVIAPCLLAVGVAGDRMEMFPLTAGAAGVLIGVILPLTLSAIVTAVVLRGGNRWWWAAITWGAAALTTVIGAVIWLTWPGSDQDGSLRTVLLSVAGCVPGLVIAAVAAHRVQPRVPA